MKSFDIISLQKLEGDILELLEFPTLAVIFVMGFISAFIDAIVGGGGLISMPTLMWVGLPMPWASWSAWQLS